jgi:uncharacterized protein
MSPEAAKTVEPFKILIAKDRLRAWIHQPNLGRPGHTPPQADSILSSLNSLRIVVDDAVRTKVEQFATLTGPSPAEASAGSPPETPENYLVAEGLAPVEAADGAFEWAPELQPESRSADSDESIDHFNLNLIRTVEAGVSIGQIKPPTDGAPGRDVFGRDLAPRRRHGTPMKVGVGLRTADDGATIVTEVAGRVLVDSGKLRIEDVLKIRGDIDLESGNLDVCTDVHVQGTVRSKFHVRTTKSLFVGRAVEAANLDVGGEIQIDGGLCGAGTGPDATARVRSGGPLAARFCNEAIVYAGGGISIGKETLNSRVRTPAKFISKRGTIIGGDVWAREGMEIGVVGSEAHVTTRVAIGASPQLLRRAQELEEKGREQVESAQLIRGKVQPLLANLKRLTPAQRETATELMAKADEIEFGASELQAERARILEQARPQGSPYLLVLGEIHPGVRIGLGDRQVRVDRIMHGPLRIEERKVQGATELVAVNQQTGSVTVLPSSEIDPTTWPADEIEPAGGEDVHNPAAPQPHPA